LERGEILRWEGKEKSEDLNVPASKGERKNLGWTETKGVSIFGEPHLKQSGLREREWGGREKAAQKPFNVYLAENGSKVFNASGS